MMRGPWRCCACGEPNGVDREWCDNCTKRRSPSDGPVSAAQWDPARWMMIKEWTTDEKGERYPVYTPEEAQRIARAAWGVHYLLPHPDDVASAQDAMNIREFHRALQALPKL